jgi:hypothetical protein
METHLEKVKLVSFLSLTFYEKIQKDLYSLLLSEEHSKPENIVETMLFGKAHLKSKMATILNDDTYVQMFDNLLLHYIWGYYSANKLQKVCNTTFIKLFTSRREFYRRTLETFIYNEPGDLLATDVFTAFYIRPLQEPVIDLCFDVEASMEFYVELKKYVRFLDMWIDGVAISVKASINKTA